VKHEWSLEIPAFQLLNLENVDIDIDPFFHTNTYALGSRSWNMVFSQNNWRAQHYRGKVRFYNSTNPKQSISFKVAGTTDSLIKDAPSVLKLMRDSGLYIGGVPSYNGYTKRVLEVIYDEQITKLGQEINNQRVKYRDLQDEHRKLENEHRRLQTSDHVQDDQDDSADYKRGFMDGMEYRPIAADELTTLEKMSESIRSRVDPKYFKKKRSAPVIKLVPPHREVISDVEKKVRIFPASQGSKMA